MPSTPAWLLHRLRCRGSRFLQAFGAPFEECDGGTAGLACAETVSWFQDALKVKTMKLRFFLHLKMAHVRCLLAYVSPNQIEADPKIWCHLGGLVDMRSELVVLLKTWTSLLQQLGNREQLLVPGGWRGSSTNWVAGLWSFGGPPATRLKVYHGQEIFLATGTMTVGRSLGKFRASWNEM